MTATYCPIHRKTHFYKYTTCETALLIFKNRKVRYSSPILFNDPFDVQTNLRFDFDLRTLPQLIQEEIEDIIFSRKDVKLNKNDTWGEAILFLKEKVTVHGYYAKELKDLITALLIYLVSVADRAILNPQ